MGHKANKQKRSKSSQPAPSASRRAWTRQYEPFRLGGNLHTAICADLPCSGPFELGHGYEGYVAISPLTGKMHVIEACSGGLVDS